VNIKNNIFSHNAGVIGGAASVMRARVANLYYNTYQENFARNVGAALFLFNNTNSTVGMSKFYHN